MISIIIPVYNAEEVLHRCVDSVLSQSYGDFELILVDDGSKDSSGAICDDYARLDCRVKVHHQENGGPSKARNTGLDNASGHWICFIDSDDWVEADYLSCFMEACGQANNCLVVQNYHKDTVGQHGDVLFTQPRHRYARLEVDRTNVDYLIQEYGIQRNGHPFCKLYLREVIESNAIRFDRAIHFSEDLLFLLEYAKYVDRIVFLPDCYYHYISSGASLTNAYHSFESEMTCYRRACTLFDDFISATDVVSEKTQQLVYGCRGHFIVRAIESMYRPKTYRPQKFRLAAIRELYSEEKVRDFSAMNASGVKAFGSMLYRNRQFVLFDLVQLMQFRVRYLLGPVWTRGIRAWSLRKQQGV